MITYEQALLIHELSIKEFGGGSGIRDGSGLMAALARPYAAFGGDPLYQTVFERAAAIGESIMNHRSWTGINERVLHG